MRVAWWMYNTTDPSQFTMNSPKHCNAVFRSLIDRGHSLVLNHFIRPPVGQKASKAVDAGPFASYWDDSGFPQYAHEKLSDICREVVDMDPQNRAQRKLKEWIDSDDWTPLDHVDVQYVELFPCVSLRAKLELAHAVLRGVLSGVPTVLCDQDYNGQLVLSTIEDIYRLGEGNGWSREEFRKLFYLWTPYVRRIYSGHQVVALPSYSVEREEENPLDRDAEVNYTFAYVGNDYQREEHLARFYKRRHDDGREVKSVVYGRWDLDKYSELKEVIGEEAFKGPVPPNRIHACYREAAASVGITHRAFYGAKLVAFRWLEVAEAGRLFFVDKRLDNNLGLFAPERFVEAPERAVALLDQYLQTDRYWAKIEEDRIRLRADARLQPSWTVKALEAIRMGLHKDFPWTEPHQRDVEPKVI